MTLDEAIKILAESGIENPRHEAKIIFSEIGKKSNLDLISKDCESNLVDEAVFRRSKREPLQYIIGRVGFFREEYFVNQSCLIPRSDTEILVEYAVNNIRDGESFIDLCSGSGCVAISTLKNTNATTATAVEISEGAADIIKKNAEHNGVTNRLSIKIQDALKEAVEGEFFALLSNPPYVREDVYKKLEKEIFFEPKIAFVAEDFGLQFYKKIIPLYKDKIKKGGFMAFEIGFDQGSDLLKIAEDFSLGCEILKDYSGNDRVAVIRM